MLQNLVLLYTNDESLCFSLRTEWFFISYFFRFKITVVFFFVVLFFVLQVEAEVQRRVQQQVSLTLDHHPHQLPASGALDGGSVATFPVTADLSEKERMR